MNSVYIRLFKIYHGPPDLAVHVVAGRSWIYGGPLNGYQDISPVTVTVQNRFSIPLPSVPVAEEEPNTVAVFGSDARNVEVTITLTNGLQQIGNLGSPSGFQVAVAPDRKTIHFSGGTIPTGGSVDFHIDVMGEYGCGYQASILAQVDARSNIMETDESNNMGSATIWVTSIC